MPIRFDKWVFSTFLVCVIATRVVMAQPAAPAAVVEPQEVRPLPGRLDDVLMFNSNSPEVVQTEGILLSTFPPEDKRFPAAHLNFLLDGQFELFLHHIAKAPSAEDLRTLYLGVLLHNGGSRRVKVKILQAVSYLSQPDAPFVSLPPQQENRDGKIFAGPGDRTMSEVLRGRHQKGWRHRIVLRPGETRMLMNLPIPVATLMPPLNGRSALVRVKTIGSIYAASVAMFAKTNKTGNERAPTIQEWESLLETGDLAGPRENTATPPGFAGQYRYGRVAGVARGADWKAMLGGDTEGHPQLPIPEPGKAYSYPIATADKKTLGTEQIQSAPLIVRYSDTAFQAHGNYAVKYDLSLPLVNGSNDERTVTVSLQTPATGTKDSLTFFDPPPEKVSFRGTVLLSYLDDRGRHRTRYVHLVQRQGERGSPLVSLSLSPRQQRLLRVQFFYPPDATPPQVLTVRTLRQLK